MAPTTSDINLDQPLNTGNISGPLIIVFIVLNCIGFVGSTLILGTALFARNVKRDGTWINFAVSWILWSLTYIILFITGQQYAKQPLFAVCMTQAALVYASPVLAAFATLALALQLLYRIRWVLSSQPQGKGISRIKQRYFIIIPWVAFILILIEAFVVAGFFPNSVAVESGMYCGIANGIAGRVTAVVVTLTMSVLLGVLITALRQIYPVWNSFDGRVQSRGSVSPRLMVLRLAIFSVLAFFCVLLGFVYISQVGSAQDPANIVLACLPIAFCIIFGLQKDILNAWAFWRKSTPPPSPKDFAMMNDSGKHSSNV